MKGKQVVRAWKDEEYRLSLSDAERSGLPENPAGTIELTDADLAGATGGLFTFYHCTGSIKQRCCI